MGEAGSRTPQTTSQSRRKLVRLRCETRLTWALICSVLSESWLKRLTEMRSIGRNVDWRSWWPWAAPLRSNKEFAAAYAAMDVKKYELIVDGTVPGLFDRDTVPGVEADGD